MKEKVSSTWSKIGSGLLGLVALIFIYNLFFNSSGIEQEGYFKSEFGGDRVFSFSFEPDVTESEIREHAKEQIHTAGKLTGGYYFPKNTRIPRDRLTMAKNLYEANNMINEFAPYIDYAYVKTNNEKFVNCIKNPKDGLCAQH